MKFKRRFFKGNTPYYVQEDDNGNNVIMNNQGQVVGDYDDYESALEESEREDD